MISASIASSVRRLRRREARRSLPFRGSGFRIFLTSTCYNSVPDPVQPETFPVSGVSEGDGNRTRNHRIDSPVESAAWRALESRLAAWGRQRPVVRVVPAAPETRSCGPGRRALSPIPEPSESGGGPGNYARISVENSSPQDCAGCVRGRRLV